jgi:SAM-dependent methyltransferase
VEAGHNPSVSQDEAGAFSDLETTFDPSTTRYLAAIGVRPGWHCWEVAAGGGSIARWLGERVGPGGSVLATDLNTDAFSGPVADNVQLSRHDVSLDAAPEARFDLVHARLVLSSLPGRDEIVLRLVRALRPGGWLVIEEFCSAFHVGSDPWDDEDRLLRHVQDALLAVLVGRGSDFAWASTLAQRLRTVGLREVGAEGRLILGTGGSAATRLIASTLLQFERQIVDAGMTSEADLGGVLRALNRPQFAAFLPLLMSAWGRRSSPA